MNRRYHGRAVYFPATGTLVVADLHIGRDETSDLELRIGEHEDVTARVADLCSRFEPSEIVVAGDLLHSFATLPRGVMETLSHLKSTARDTGARLIVTPGNHDTMLTEVWEGPTVDEYRVGEWIVCHGHEPPDADAAGYVIGHDHPAIEIEGQRRPCFLYGPDVYRGADVLILPAFTGLAAGVKINRISASDFQSPIVTDADALRPVVWDAAAGESLTFPPLGEFRRLL